MKRTITAIALTLLAVPVSAQEVSSVIPRAMNNLAHEYVICAAYFSIVAIAAENSNDAGLADQYYAVANSALESATMVGEEADLLPETHGARFDIAVKDMSDRINGNTSNISILFAAHSDECQEAMNNLEGRMQHYISQEFEREFGYPMPQG